MYMLDRAIPFILFFGNLIICIVACFKKKMWLASLSFLLYVSLQLLPIAAMFFIGLPDSYLVEGPKISYEVIVLVVMCVSLIAAVCTIYLRNRDNPHPVQDSPWIRWLYLALAGLLMYGGQSYFLITVKHPIIVGSQAPMIKNGGSVYLIATFIGVPILYFTSKLNSVKRPNLMRWLAVFIAIQCVPAVFHNSALLMYFMPVEPRTAYPFWAALMTISIVPYCLLLLGLTKDFVSRSVSNARDTAFLTPASRPEQ
jgi:hypothetical protein